MASPRKMVYLDFDKYMFTKLEDIDTISEAVEHIVDAYTTGLKDLSEVKARTGMDYVLLVSVTLYGDVEWELRLIGIDDDVIIITNIDNNYDESTIRKVMIEAFAIKRRKVIDSLDMIREAGFAPIVASRVVLSSKLSEILKASLEDEMEQAIIPHGSVESEPREARAGGAGAIDSSHITHDSSHGSGGFSRTLALIGQCISESARGRLAGGGQDSGEGLRDTIILAGEDRYLCVMRSSRDCGWLVIEISSGSTISRCYNDTAKVLEIVDSLLRNGYEDITEEISRLAGAAARPES